jgi:hypothetical protein
MNNRGVFRREELWITSIEMDQLWFLIAWLISQPEVRQALLAAPVKKLPVISY